MRLCDFSNILGEGGKLLTALKLLVALVGGGLTLTNPLGVSC